MTLQDVLNLVGANPIYAVAYFLLLPLTAWLAGAMSKDEGNLPPWNYLYAVLIYAVCIPGIFALTLNVYLFLFERRSIFQADIFAQILPIFSMIATLLIIRKNADFDYIPGFERISGLVMMITASIALMWFLDRTHIFAFISMNFWQVFGIFALFMALIWGGWKRFLR